MRIGNISVVVGTLALSTICVAGLRGYATKRMFDIPNARSLHTRPIPRGGGLGIVFSLLCGICISYNPLIQPIPSREIVAFGAGSVIIALVGWLDDIYSVSIFLRLIAQSLSSIIVLIKIGYFNVVSFPLLGDVCLSSIGIPFTFLWIIALVNIYNFMDGIDGIAGGQAVIAGLGWSILGLISGQWFVGSIGLLLAASSLGFLLHNWPPARIFMGDVGSFFIGFTLAVLPVIAGRRNPRLIVAGFLVVWPFLFDTSFTLVRRVLIRENIFIAHRSHIYQRLVIAGFSHRFVTLIYMGLALAGTVIALLWYKKASFASAMVIFFPILLFIGLWRFAIRAESRTHSGA